MTAVPESIASTSGDGVVAFVEVLDAAQSVLRAIGDHAFLELPDGSTVAAIAVSVSMPRLA